LRRFDQLPEEYATELWKYCVLYTGLGNVYYEGGMGDAYKENNIVSLIPWDGLLISSSVNLAIQLSGDGDGGLGDAADADSSANESAQASRIHHSFLQIHKPRSRVCGNMMRVLVQDKNLVDPVRLSELLGLFVANDSNKQEWQLMSARCLWAGARPSLADMDAPLLVDDDSSKKPMMQMQCPMSNRGFCCQAWLPESSTGSWPALAIREPYLAPRSSSPDGGARFRPFIDTQDESELSMAVEDFPYIATIRQEPTTTATEVKQRSPTPNFFHILAENDCLPEGRECFRCLKKVPENKDEYDCDRCRDACPCYCNALCSVRPPPKRVSAKWFVRPPRLRRAPDRFIPRIIHQTWYEPITKEKYPNMSRLIESFRQQSGWQYNFYTDDEAAQFLSTHFPPEVREAYDTLLPGAFKADLFRYCVLLIRGGVYADMDIMLSSNLDSVIDASVGFMTAQDEPGIAVGHRSCLWNGLMASAPAHPFLIHTIQNVVNNIVSGEECRPML